MGFHGNDIEGDPRDVPITRTSAAAHGRIARYEKVAEECDTEGVGVWEDDLRSYADCSRQRVDMMRLFQKAMGEVIKFRVASRTSGRAVVVSVNDNGIGMASRLRRTAAGGR